MPLLKVQLNHPGNEMPFKLGKGYQFKQPITKSACGGSDNQIIGKKGCC